MPDAAIGTEQVRKYVMVVDADSVARTKVVVPGPLIDGLRVIASGLEAGDRVVVSGLMHVRPGAKVVPKLAEATTVMQHEMPPAH